MKKRRILAGFLALVMAGPVSSAGAVETGGPLVADVAAQGKTRAHGLEFVMPEGWTRASNNEGNLLIMPPGIPAGHRCEIHISAFTQHLKRLDQHSQDSLDNLHRDFRNVKVVQPTRVETLPTGVKAATLICTANEKDEKLPPIRVHFIDADGNGDGKEPTTAEGIAFVASSSELWEKHWPTYQAFLKTISFPSHTKLAEPKDGFGLTMYTVYTCVDFCEWFMDVPFTQEQRAVMQQYMVDVWRGEDAKSKEEREGLQEIIKASNEVAKLWEPAKKKLAREAVRQEALAQWRKEAATDKMAAFMIGIYDAANKPIAQGKAGEPALTRQGADATMEVLHFMASKAAGYDVEPGKQQKDEFAQKLAAAYALTPAEMKTEIAQMPLYWAALRVQWPELPADERKKLADAWGASEAIKPIIEEIKKAKAKAAADRVYKPTEQLAAMQKLYQQQQNAAMISNMMAMQHRTNMTIINNIGSSNYRYEYKTVYRYR
ncbi:MAG TPA: hypothetical protein VK986_20290 [Tepidisphaeraceae bacterium]|nr:hypothetical protein [Tepidisphaeraceae bacterium]